MDFVGVFHTSLLPMLNKTNGTFLCCSPLYPPYFLHHNQSISSPLDSTKSIFITPWRPADAFNANRDNWPPSEAYTGAWQFGEEIRQWDHKNRRWYYHTAPDVDSTINTSYTGGIIVGFLVVLLWLYSFYRLWMVWAYTLNFDGAIVQGQKGWDFLVTWVLYTINAKKRRRMLRAARKRERILAQEVFAEEGDWEKNIDSPESETLLCFPNLAKFENDFTDIYQFHNTGFGEKVQPRDKSRTYHQPNRSRRNRQLSSRSYSLDQSTLYCYNELNRTFKSNCDFHFSRSGSDKWSSQIVHLTGLAASQLQQKPEVNNIRKHIGSLVVNKNSYSTDV